MESCWLGGGGGEGEGTRMWGWVKKKIKGGEMFMFFIFAQLYVRKN